MSRHIPHPKQRDLFGFTTKEQIKLEKKEKKKRNNRRKARSAKRRAR